MPATMIRPIALEIEAAFLKLGEEVQILRVLAGDIASFTTPAATMPRTRSATTTTAGIDTTVCYAVEQNTFYIPSGVYQATVVASATLALL